jgi:RHS repeat-associated protein
MSQRSETTYDAIGHVKETKDFNGDVIKYGYDQQNQLISKQFVGEGDRIETYNTAADARSRTVTDARGTTSYAYDEQGRMLSKTEPDGKQISYTYDLATGKVASVTTPSGTTQYRYNGLDQLIKVISTEGETTYAYNAIGNLQTKILPNDIVEFYGYDSLNRVKSIEQKNAVGTVLASYVYSYDLVGNKTKVEELGGRVISYTYDELYRLTKESIVDPAHGNRTMKYVYDAVGNRLLKNDTEVGDIVYRYNQNDWLLDESLGNFVATAYTYDSNGNTKTKVTATETTNYVWDTQNRLTSAVITANGQTKQLGYKYNTEGMRVRSTVDGVETSYLLDENRQYAQVLEEYNSSGLQSRYVYGAELDLLSQTYNAATSFYLEDGHSGVRQLTNVAGTVTDQYGYDGYGNVIYSIGSTQNTYQYRGEQSNLSLGMQYLRARYYDTENGRFASADPFDGYKDSPMSRHRYVYGSGNPIAYSDPSGKFSYAEFAIAQTGLFLLQLFGTGLGAGIVTAGIGLGIASLSGGYTKWNGGYFQLDVSLKEIGHFLRIPIGITGSGLAASAKTEVSQGTQVSATWLILLAGIDVSALPFPVNAEISTFHAASPKLFDRKTAGKSLSGPVAFGGAGLSIGAGQLGQVGADWSYFTMGLGYGWVTPEDTSISIKAGVELLAGISILQ